MTLDRDLDRRLVVLFDERAVTSPPADLLARSVARIEATRQRPGWLSGNRTRGKLRIGQTLVPAWAVLILTALLLLAVVIVGSQLIHQRQSVVPPLETAPLQTKAIETPPETPSPTRGPGFAARPGMFAMVRDLKAASDEVAWIATETGIYRTDDVGKTWRGVTPEGWTRSWSEVFVDADTGYVSPGGSPAVIEATHDGGETWDASNLDVGTASWPPVFSMHSSTDGYATFFDPNGPALSTPGALKVFHTTDGGATWSLPAGGSVPHMAESSDKVYGPIGDYLYQSAGKAPGKAYDNRFFLSADGATTWAEYKFPINSNSPKNAMKGIVALIREDNGRLLASFDAYADGPGGFPNGIYESTDDPSTWRLVYTGPEIVQFLAATTWITTSGGIRSTTDAGASWRTVNSSTDLYWASARQWASVQTGWATEACRWVADCALDPDATVVLVTSDGGATWHEVGK